MEKRRNCSSISPLFHNILDSNKPAHLRCLTRVFIVRLMKLCILGYPKYAQQRFWSDCANAQADLNLRWSHMSEGTFSDVMANLRNRKILLRSNQQNTSDFLLRGLDTLDWFSAISAKGENPCDFLFTAHQVHSEQGCTLEGKNLLPFGANCYVYEYTLTRRGAITIMTSCL